MLAECYPKQDMFNHKELFTLNGENTLVTGGTGAIGSDIASEFSKLSQKVTILGRNQDKLASISEQNKNITPFYLDITNQDEQKKFSQKCDPFDNIILCHGIPASRPLRMVDKKYIENVIDINLTSTISLLAFLQRARKIMSPGRIIYLSSVAARMGAANNIAYSASKLGGEAAMNSIARDFLKKDITVNSIAPAGIETPIYSGTKPKVIDPKLYPLGRGLVSDTTSAALFLCLKGSKYITGETIILSGGTKWLG